MKRRITPRIAALGLVVVVLAGCEARDEAGLLATARQQLAAQETNAALITLKAALQKQPELAGARQLLGQILLETGDVKGAVAELSRALDLGHDPEVTVPWLARALVADGQAAEVLATLANRPLAGAPARADLLTSVARAQLATGKPDQAEQSLRQAVAADPAHVPAQLLQARLRARGGDVAGALAQIQAVTAATPKAAAPWVLQAELLLQTPGNEAAATAAYRQALAADAAHAPALAGLAGQALAAMKPEEARAPVEALLKLAPRSPLTRELQTRLALDTGQHADAREAAQQWLRLTPDDPRALLVAGQAEWLLGARVPAQTFLRKAITNAPDSIPAQTARLLLAQTQLAGGEAEAALQTLEPLLQAPKPQADSLALAAQAQLQRGEAGAARALFARAAQSEPQNLSYRLAVLLGDIGTPRDRAARAQLEALTQSDGTGQAAQALATERLSRRDVAGALAAIELAQRRQAPGVALQLLRAKALQAQGDQPQSRAAFEQVLQIDPANAEATVALSGRDVAEGRAVLGLARMRSLLARQPRNVPLQLTYAQLQAQAGARRSEVLATLEEAVASTSTDVAPSIALIRHHLASDSKRQALAAAQAALAAYPGDAQVTYALGQAQLAAGEAQQAVRSFKQVAIARPGAPEVMLELARAHRATGQIAPAQAVLDELLKAEPRFVPAHRLRMELAIDRQDWPAAMAMAQAQQKREPARPEGWFWQAAVHGAQRQWEPSAAALRQALARGGGAEVAMRLVSVLRAQGQASEAERFAAQWLHQQPRDTVLRMALADLAGRGGDLPGAEQQYRAVLEVEPEHTAAMNNLAWVLARQRKPGAVALAERVNRLHPDRPELMDTWATALAAEGQTGKAIQLLQRAIQQAPDQPGLWLSLADVALQNGDKYLARTQLTRLQALGKQFPDQARVTELLKGVQ